MDILKKEDLDPEEALQLLTPMDLEKLGLSIGQKRVLEVALKKLRAYGTQGVQQFLLCKPVISDGGSGCWQFSCSKELVHNS